MPPEFTIPLSWTSTLNVPVLSSPGVSSWSELCPSLPASLQEHIFILSSLHSNPLLRCCFALRLSEHIKGVCFDCPYNPSGAYWWGCSLDWESSPFNSLKKKRKKKLFQFSIITIIEMLRQALKSCSLHAQHSTSFLPLLPSFFSTPLPLYQHLSCWHLKT